MEDNCIVLGRELFQSGRDPDGVLFVRHQKTGMSWNFATAESQTEFLLELPGTEWFPYLKDAETWREYQMKRRRDTRWCLRFAKEHGLHSFEPA